MRSHSRGRETVAVRDGLAEHTHLDQVRSESEMDKTPIGLEALTTFTGLTILTAAT